MKTLVTIILASNRPANIKEFLSNIEEKSTYPEQVEIIFSIDTGDSKSIQVLKEMQGASRLKIKYLEGSRDIGYFEAQTHYNDCLHLADPDSYFFAIFSDKLKMDTNGWDEELKKYVGHFKDDFFRIRVSRFKNIRYNLDLLDALTRPDNFAFHTRKFLELSGGWGDTWGPDTWIQGVVFFCELLGIKDRDIAAQEINLHQYIYSDTRAVNRASFIKNFMGLWSFKYLSTNAVALENFLRIAMKMKFYVDNYLAFNEEGKNRFSYDSNNLTILDANNEVVDFFVIAPDKYVLTDAFWKKTQQQDNTKKTVVTSPDIKEVARLSRALSKRIVKRKQTKNKLRKFILAINVSITKFRIKHNIGIKKVTHTFTKEERDYDLGQIIKIQSWSDQFTIEVNSIIDEAVKAKYKESDELAEALFPKKIIELAQSKNVTPEMLSFLDHGYVVEILTRYFERNNSTIDDKVLVKFYADLGFYLMNSGLQDFAADMFKLSLEKEHSDDVAILYLQNLMYTSPEKFSDEKIYNITREMMGKMLQEGALTKKYDTYKNSLQPDKILNIGYVCHFFDNETSTNLILPILAAHNRDRVKIFVYSDQDPKITRPQTRALADVWHDMDMTDLQFCEQVRKDKIDILFELNGFTIGNRYRAINAKPAPVQVSFYNLSATCGVEGIDYMISTNDIKLDQRFYSEKIINKEGVYLTISPDVPLISNVAPFTKNGYITFGSFGQIHKVTRKQVMLWAEVLKRVENSKFYFKSGNLNKKEIVSVFRKHFEDAGIEFSTRVIVDGPSPYNDLIKCYEKIDIALDTFPYAGGTTTSEAMLCGVPVLHLTGERFCTQHGTNYLRYFNTEELICNNREEFIEKAVKLAEDREKIKWYRENLPILSRQSKKCDIKGYTKELEDVCFEMWRNYLAQKKAA